MIHMDDLHFFVEKNKSQFKVKAQGGPFTYNTRATGKEVDFLLKQMKFKLSFTWSYGAFGIISKSRVEQKTTPYTHTPRPEINKFMNQNHSEENTYRKQKNM